MNLIEFITENIYFGVIILFAIISFFAKNREKPQPPPSHEGEPAERSQRVPIETRQVPEMKNTTEDSPSFNEVKKQMKVLKLASDQLEMQKKSLQESTHDEVVTLEHLERTPYDLKRKVSGGFVGKNLTSEVIKGKMWSEVFGPPRAKNPYRARR